MQKGSYNFAISENRSGKLYRFSVQGRRERVSFNLHLRHFFDWRKRRGGGREMVARRDVGKSCLMQRKRKIFGKGGEGNWRWRRTRTIGKREHLRRLN